MKETMVDFENLCSLSLGHTGKSSEDYLPCKIQNTPQLGIKDSESANVPPKAGDELRMRHEARKGTVWARLGVRHGSESLGKAMKVF